MSASPSKILDVTAAGTQVSAFVLTEYLSDVGIVISHPAATTTTYTMEVSNNTDDEVRRGIDIWANYELRDGAGTVLPAKSAAEDFTVTVRPPYRRKRIKAVTSVGSGNLRAWAQAYPVGR